MHINVYIQQNFIRFDRACTYSAKLDKKDLFADQRVRTPFGKEILMGTVLAIDVENTSDFEAKKILGTLEDQVFLPKDLMVLTGEMSERYFIRPFTSLVCTLPPGNGRGIFFDQGKFKVENSPDLSRYGHLRGQGKNPSQEEVPDLLKSQGPLLRPEILGRLDVSASPIQTLIKNGIIGPVKEEKNCQSP